mmetsp:Transcript_36720/g.98379  ORF Transcript_36720/g.98379 Transcript_36720/m.98379 type:complete len:397 (+) Transcript_36720:66-1256(+)
MAYAQSTRSHLRVCAAVTLIDVVLVALLLAVHRAHPRRVPDAGQIDTSALVGWLGTFAAIIIFGCYGILLKTPAIKEANVDSMIFQVYFSIGVAACSLLIWAAAGGAKDPVLSWLGFVFGGIWIVQQVFAFNAVQLVGYAVGPAIWAGLTMVVSFTWGVTAFGHVVSSWRGSCPALGLLVLGVCLAAASGSDTARKLGRRQLRQAQEGTYGTCCEDGLLVPADAAGPARGALRTALGCGCAVAVGLMNGTLMVPVTFFQSGSSTLGISGYKGNLLSPIAFLPSLSIGILCMQVPTFLIYFARDIYEGRLPKFQAAVAAAPGLVTGAYWAMGNFASMFAMTYLGQTIGFPLTQTCIVVGGLWGIFYYGEIEGRLPITMFAVSVALIITGAALDGRYG